MALTILAAALEGLFCTVFSIGLWNYTPNNWICEQKLQGRFKFEPLKAPSSDHLAVFLIFFISMMMTEGEKTWLSFPLYIILFQLCLCDSLTLTLQDQWSLYLAAAGILKTFVSAFASQAGLRRPLTEIKSSLTAAVCLWLLWIMSALLCAIAKKDSPMGMGDVKLLSAAALLLDTESFLKACCAAFLSSGIYAMVIVMTGKQKRDQIAFGPFICLGIILYL